MSFYVECFKVHHCVHKMFDVVHFFVVAVLLEVYKRHSHLSVGMSFCNVPDISRLMG